MNDFEPNIYIILLTTIAIWNFALSVYIFRAGQRYKKLTQGTNNRNLEQIIAKLIEKYETNTSGISQISQNLIEFQKRSMGFMQKVGILRFNPFEESGGDQSFAIAILDGEGSGFIISSLHSRSGTRIYAKEIKSGKSTSHSLTKEEKEALEKALRRK